MILDKNTINTENFCDLTLAEYASRLPTSAAGSAKERGAPRLGLAVPNYAKTSNAGNISVGPCEHIPGISACSRNH